MKHDLDMKEKLIESRITDIFDILGIQFKDDNIDTPARIAKMLNRELFKSLGGNNIFSLADSMTKFNNPNKGDNIIEVKSIKFYSMCEHHWLPFYGYCDIEYIPKNNILGLSKFARVVDYWSKLPQVQEGLTRNIGKFLVMNINPKYLKVTLRDVHHLCVEMRGAESECVTNTYFVYKEGDILD